MLEQTDGKDTDAALTTDFQVPLLLICLSSPFLSIVLDFYFLLLGVLNLEKQAGT